MKQRTRKPLLVMLLLGLTAGPLRAQPLPEHLMQALDRFLIHEVQTRYALVIANDEATGNPAILGFARYVDEYRKEGEQWLISRRQIIMDMSNDAVMASLGL
jgi:hypothetical protein